MKLSLMEAFHSLAKEWHPEKIGMKSQRKKDKNNKKEPTMKKFIIFMLSICVVVFFSKNCTNTKITEDMYKFIPKDVTSLSSFDFQKFKKIKDFPEIYSMWKKGLSKSTVESEFHKFIKIAGFDFKKNLIKIVIFTGPPRIDKTLNIGMVIKIKFDNDKLLRAINTFLNKEEVENYLGIAIHSVFFKDTREKHSIAAPDPSHLLIGPKEILKDMIDVHKGNKKCVLSNKKVRHFIYGEKESHIAWLTLLFADLIKAEIQKNPVGFPPIGLESLSFFLREKDVRTRVISHSEFEIKRFAQFLITTRAMIPYLPPRNDEEKMFFTLFENASIMVTSSSVEIIFKAPRMMMLMNDIVYKNFLESIRKGNFNIKKLI